MRRRRASGSAPDPSPAVTKPPRAVLFDLGGVLLPFDPERRIAAIVARTGAAPDAARAFMASDLPRRLDTGAADAFDLAEAYRTAFGVDIGRAEATDLTLSVFEIPNHELWALAAALRARAVVGGFSDNPAFVERVFPPGAVLDPMFFSSRIGACKPSPQAFAAVEAGLGLAPAEILFIDDTAANAQAARIRGWDAILYRSNRRLIADLAARGLP
jgi:FMN phosphatase YigB (HAD superfamily)